MLKSEIVKKKIPEAPGIYLFKQNSNIIYIGKATSLKNRVNSYFGADLIQTRGPLLVDMVHKATDVEFIKTDSVLEAIILEINLIKKYQPKYNTKEKDNKSFNYVIITKEDWPRILIERGKNLLDKKRSDLKELKYTIFGPFPNAKQLKSALKIIRKIFPFRDKCSPNQNKPCFNKQLGLCPGICDKSISNKDYASLIKNIILFFKGEKKKIIKNLNQEMKAFVKKGEYEKALIIRDKIFSLNHIQDVALINNSDFDKKKQNKKDIFRIEAYDISHLSGTNNVGVMVVMENEEFKKSDYRKFSIKNTKGNDIGALAEILERRLKHKEWPNPDLIVVDGGLAHLNITQKIINKKYSIVAVTKDAKHNPKILIGNDNIIKKYKKEILSINNEAHRFAIAFHRQKRNVIIKA